ncbi:MAG: hypothetical protein KGL36_03500 [Gammaproteobacteria bacterium]|nr:hypothetical protein [Gammaproteobacteria bacterium]
MNADELDALYTALCRAMTSVGEAQAPILLARFALLAIVEIADADRLRQLIAAAAEDLPDASGRGHT